MHLQRLPAPMRIALGIEYDGRAFCGWQTQPSGCGVQDALERALREIGGAAIPTVCAGRTDAGVHACWQVVHFDAPHARPLSAWTRGVNALLPPGVAVLWAADVADAFHARYGALERQYRYVLVCRHQRLGLEHGRAGWWHGDLDVEAMQAAARTLLGEHDFSAFRAADCQAASPVRTLLRADIQASGAVIRFDFRANAFLQHMVRNLVGALVYVGAARRDAAWIASVLAARDRSLGAPTFMPDGLYLTGVKYSPDFGLADGPDHSVLP